MTFLLKMKREIKEKNSLKNILDGKKKFQTLPKIYSEK